LYYAFENQDYLFFVIEYCSGGEMLFQLRLKKQFTEEQSKFFIIEICLALKYIHKENILYRDIKPENIFMDINGHIRIGDFGLSKNIEREKMAYSFCGSPEYMCPEMLLKKGHNQQLDYYCLGALLYEFITGLPPFYLEKKE